VSHTRVKFLIMESRRLLKGHRPGLIGDVLEQSIYVGPKLRM